MNDKVGKVPPDLMKIRPVVGVVGTAPKEASEAIWSVPPPKVTPPLNVFWPERLRVAIPDWTSATVPAPSAIVPLKVGVPGPTTVLLTLIVTSVPGA